MKNIVSYSLVAIIATMLMAGCGSSLKVGKNDEEASKRQVEASKSLVQFMDENPAIAKASLSDIRNAAGGSARSSLVAKDSVESNLPVYSKALPKADEAVVLIDKVVDSFKAKTVFDAAIRVIAVAMTKFPEDAVALIDSFVNEENEAANKGPKQPGKDVEVEEGTAGVAKLRAMMVAKAEGEGKPEHAEGHGRGKPKKGSAQVPDVGMTCEEILEDPIKLMQKMDEDVTEKEVEDFLSETEKELKNFVRTCKHIDGGNFAKCAELVTGSIANLNSQMTCSIDKFSEVEKIIGKSVADMKAAMKPCMAAFSNCGLGVKNSTKGAKKENAGAFGEGAVVGEDEIGGGSAEPMKKPKAPKKK